MSRRVRLAPEAQDDLGRLVRFLHDRSPAAARRARQVLETSLRSLGELPERGSPHPKWGSACRELKVRFGRYGYVLQYRVTADEVLVAQIRHALETR